ncbi:hypothetical protein CKAN_01732900 [Cinnamomum micranthum f. kanehirae]|uniref:Uncharacterized protein n=1 Tax=Cinnamomum micranthum f. kanehirae TaxID=337451 RepID=A0A3S3NX38_9MAGN|nr:hypothetical protein CKAN_01732900 [Cinnamomum micranthum f. kanehirae]
MFPAFLTSCSELISRWEELVGSEGSSELDVWHEFQNFTGDVISRTAFGSSYKQGMRIFQLQTEHAQLLCQYDKSKFILGYRFLPLKENKRRNEIDKEGNSNATAMTTEEVIDECKLFYFAGQETTSVLLIWTMVVLSMHPMWQLQARGEVLQVFGKNQPEFDGLNHFKILKVIYLFIYQIQHEILIYIGQNFALIEAKMALSIVLQHFSFELSPSYTHAPYTLITLQPQYGAHLILH